MGRIRGGAPGMRPNVRRLAAFANVHSCPTAAVAFADRVDTDRVLAGTEVAMPFGQSRCAIGRGVAFETLLRREDYAELRRVLTEGLGVDFSSAVVRNLRQGFPKNRSGLGERATVTRRRMAEVASAASGSSSGPVVIEGAVLTADVGGLLAFFEADEMALGVAGGIIVGENKSWPVVDGRPTDEDALGAALDQAATYVLLGRRTLDEAGADAERVSGDVVLVTPRNAGLTPVLHRQNVEGRVRRVERLLGAVPDVAEIAASIPSSVTFEQVADTAQPGEARLEAFARVTDELGRTYEPGSCLTSCGLAWACRQSAFGEGSPAIAGGAVARALPGVLGLGRVAELGRGALASAAEKSAAEPIARAGRLYDEAVVTAGEPYRRSA